MKNLTLIGAIVCLLIGITSLVAIPFCLSCTDTTITIYFGTWIVFSFGFIFLLREYIQECKDKAYWDGYKKGFSSAKELYLSELNTH
jgi:hypothetical protein